MLLELAIVRLLMEHKKTSVSQKEYSVGKVVYSMSFLSVPPYGAVAPIKALCSERFNDWERKFRPLVRTFGDALLRFRASSAWS